MQIVILSWPSLVVRTGERRARCRISSDKRSDPAEQTWIGQYVSAMVLRVRTIERMRDRRGADRSHRVEAVKLNHSRTTWSHARFLCRLQSAPTCHVQSQRPPDRSFPASSWSGRHRNLPAIIKCTTRKRSSSRTKTSCLRIRRISWTIFPRLA